MQEKNKRVMTDNLDTQALMKRVNQGDREAFQQLYDTYAPRVMGLSYRIVQDRTLAEEVVQETFWRIWERSETFQHQRGSFQNWMFGIARNLSIDIIRKRQRRQVYSLPEEMAQQDELRHHHTSGKEVMEAVSHLMTSEHIHHALQTLPAAQQDVIQWIYFQGKTRREIAQEQNIPFGTINTRAKLALKKLREALHSYEQTHG